MKSTEKKKLVDLFNKALEFELIALNTYQIQLPLIKSPNIKSIIQKLIDEEKRHANAFTELIISLHGKPNGLTVNECTRYAIKSHFELISVLKYDFEMEKTFEERLSHFFSKLKLSPDLTEKVNVVVSDISNHKAWLQEGIDYLKALP